MRTKSYYHLALALERQKTELKEIEADHKIFLEKDGKLKADRASGAESMRDWLKSLGLTEEDI